MKQFLIIIFIIIIGVIGYAVYMRIRNGGIVVSPGIPISKQKSETSGVPTTQHNFVIPSSIPTVFQIPLTIKNPVDRSIVASSTIIVRGTTIPKADVYVNDSIARADTQGNFSVQVTLDEGDNTIVVITNDTEGNYSEKDITVTYNPGT